MAERKITPIGAKTLLGMAIQPDAECAVRSAMLVAYKRGGFDGMQQLLFSEANIDTPSPRIKSVVGDFEGSGDFTAEITPRRAIPTLLTALFGEPAETVLSPDTPVAPIPTVNGATGGTTVRKYYIVARNSNNYPSLPSVAAVVSTSEAVLTPANSVSLAWTAVVNATSYDVLVAEGVASTVADAKKIGSTAGVVFTHNGSQSMTAYKVTSVPFSRKTWKHGWDRRFLTFHQKKGDSIFTFPFAAVHKMSVRASRGQREVITADFAAKVADMWTMCDAKSSAAERSAALSETGLSTSFLDDLPPFSPAKALVKVSEVGGDLLASGRMQGFSLSFDRNTTDEYCLNGKLGPFGFVDGISGLDVTFDSYFRSGSEEDLKLFMGHSTTVSSSSKYGFQGVVKEVTTSFVLPYASGYGVDSVLEFVMPRSVYGSVGTSVGGRGEPLMQAIRVEPIYDGTEGTDLVISIVSNESKATILLDNGVPVVGPASEVQSPAPVPAQVDGFAAADGIGSSVLSWTETPGASGYLAEKSTAASGQPWTFVSQVRTPGMTVSGLAAGTVHFRVSAYTGGGYGAPSATDSAVIS